MDVAYDIIGDIHGHADRLEALLHKLGYSHRAGVRRHPERQAIFVGDLVDRGEHQVRTLRIVRAMVEAGTARAIMGNHEFNAIAWATPDRHEPGEHLRRRTGHTGQKNRRQHHAFLADVGEDSAEHKAWIEWMKQLPLWIEEPGMRVVHACWSPRHAEALKPHLADGARLTEELIENASQRGTDAYVALETLLKGEEIALPEGVSFHDKDGHERHEIRTQWWNPHLTTYRDASIGLRPEDVPDVAIVGREVIPETDRPTFIGHYWLNPREPMKPRSNRVACVDYSAGKGGPLACYRFDGESELSASKFVAA